METVACGYCGVVFEKQIACDQLRCPVCEASGERRPVPKHGNCNKWWVEA